MMSMQPALVCFHKKGVRVDPEVSFDFIPAVSFHQAAQNVQKVDLCHYWWHALEIDEP